MKKESATKQNKKGKATVPSSKSVVKSGISKVKKESVSGQTKTANATKISRKKTNKPTRTRSEEKRQFAVDFWERLQLFMKMRGDKFVHLTKQMNAPIGYFSHAIEYNCVAGTDVLAKIAKVYPELSIEWLLLGSGTMLKNARIEDVNKYENKMILHKELQKEFNELEKAWEKIKKIEIKLKK